MRIVPLLPPPRAAAPRRAPHAPRRGWCRCFGRSLALPCNGARRTRARPAPRLASLTWQQSVVSWQQSKSGGMRAVAVVSTSCAAGMATTATGACDRWGCERARGGKGHAGSAAERWRASRAAGARGTYGIHRDVHRPRRRSGARARAACGGGAAPPFKEEQRAPWRKFSHEVTVGRPAPRTRGLPASLRVGGGRAVLALTAVRLLVPKHPTRCALRGVGGARPQEEFDLEGTTEEARAPSLALLFPPAGRGRWRRACRARILYLGDRRHVCRVGCGRLRLWQRRGARPVECVAGMVVAMSHFVLPCSFYNVRTAKRHA